MFLTADAFGVLPPIARLTPEPGDVPLPFRLYRQGGRHRDRRHRARATFSTCFGAPFLPRHPSVYGNLLKERIARRAFEFDCWLVNTGWTGASTAQKRASDLRLCPHGETQIEPFLRASRALELARPISAPTRWVPRALAGRSAGWSRQHLERSPESPGALGVVTCHLGQELGVEHGPRYSSRLRMGQVGRTTRQQCLPFLGRQLVGVSAVPGVQAETDTHQREDLLRRSSSIMTACQVLPRATAERACRAYSQPTPIVVSMSGGGSGRRLVRGPEE